MSISLPKAQIFRLTELVEAVRSGEVEILESRADPPWRWEDVRLLFDSIVKGYPMGALVFSRLPSGTLRVVDGSQRLISIVHTLTEGNQDDRFDLAYDWQAHELRRTPRPDDGRAIALPTLFDLPRLLAWLSDNPDVGQEVSAIAQAISEFRVSVHMVASHDPRVLRDIRNRLNDRPRETIRDEGSSFRYARLRRPPGRLDGVADWIDAVRGFGLIPFDVVRQALPAGRAPEAVLLGGPLLQATVFLQEQLNVPHVTLLPEQHLFVALTRFFDAFPNPVRRNLDLLRRWFWRAAISGTSALHSTTGEKLMESIVAGDESGSVQRLLAALPKHDPPDPRLTNFHTNTGEARIVLCALWSLEPRSLATARRYHSSSLPRLTDPDAALANAVGRIVRDEPEGHEEWAANRLFVLEREWADEVLDLLTASPTDMPSDTWRETLESHALDEATVATLARGEVALFLEMRQERIQAITRAFLSRMTETGLEDTPPLESLNLDESDERDDGAG